MRGSVRRNVLDCPISQSAQIQVAEERFPLAERNRRNCEVNFIYVGRPGHIASQSRHRRQS